ncbi:MAG: hypothetical protein ACXWUN_02195 [Allosphingosinicella sp.]
MYCFAHARWIAGLAAATLAALPVSGQKPEEPLGELLEVLPLPEAAASEDEPQPGPPPPVASGSVVPVDVPQSAATGEIGTSDSSILDEEPAPVLYESPDARAQADADAAWAALQTQRRAKVNEVEAPITARLNEAEAARAEAARRRFERDQENYERELFDLEEDARRRRADYDAALARERAEYRARVEACRAGDRWACDGRYKF